MGNDGGSIPTRRELVKEAARNPTATELKETQKEQLTHRWSTCPLSHKPLARPVVSDCVGNLYNKDAVIQYLLPSEASVIDKEECDKVLQGRVKSLKDTVEVLFEVEVDSKTSLERWICPVTSKPLGATVKAVYLVPCGHAFSHEAVKEMKSETCIQCDQKYEMRDVIPILPTLETEKAALRSRAEALAASGVTHSLKKASGSGKKRKANGVAKPTAAGEEQVPSLINAEDIAERKEIQRSGTPRSGTSTPKPTNGIKNAATASLTARVLEEEEARKKRKKMMGENENLKSLFSKGDSRKDANGDFMTRGYSIPAKNS